MTTRALAKREHERALGTASQYLTFHVGSELMACPIATIREVIEYTGLTRIPTSSACVPGVLNLRGAVVPVIDLSVRLGRAPTRPSRRTCVIVVETSSEEGLIPVGVIVDAVGEALDVSPEQIAPRPSFGSGLRSDFVASLLRIQASFVSVVDMNTVLSLQELEQLVSQASDEAGRATLSRPASAPAER